MKPSDRPIRVLVADDSATALACICRYLEFEGLFEIVGTASDGLRLVQKAGRLRPDLVLTDLSMPLLNGFEATAELRRRFPELRIVVITQLSGLCLKEGCVRVTRLIFSQKSNYVLLRAVDGKDAVERAHAERPDLILMDVMMPRMEYDLGYIDLEEKTLQPLDNPFGPKV